MADTEQTITAKPVLVPHQLEMPYQIATHFSITSDPDGFYLFFGNADPSSIDPETLEMSIHPLYKVYIGRNMMQRLIRTLLTNQSIQDLPDLRAAREEVEQDIKDMMDEKAARDKEEEDS